MVYLVATLGLLLTSFARTSGQIVGEELCACSPSSYEFTLDFDLVCPGDVTEGDAVDETSCVITPLGDPDVTDLVPVTVENIDILELDQGLRVVAQENIAGSFSDGDTFNYTSIAAWSGDIVDPSDVPRAIQINIVGRNQFNESLINVYIITFTNGCGAYPVLAENQTIGWTTFTALEPPLREFCPFGSTHSPTPSPTLSPVTPPPVSSVPTGMPTESNVTIAPTMTPGTDIPTESNVTVAPTAAPETDMPTESNVTVVPTMAPQTDMPTESNVTVAPTMAPQTDMPTESNDSVAPTMAPTMTSTPGTVMPTPSPVTKAPTMAPTVITDAPIAMSMSMSMSMSMAYSFNEYEYFAEEFGVVKKEVRQDPVPKLVNSSVRGKGNKRTKKTPDDMASDKVQKSGKKGDNRAKKESGTKEAKSPKSAKAPSSEDEVVKLPKSASEKTAKSPKSASEKTASEKTAKSEKSASAKKSSKKRRLR